MADANEPVERQSSVIRPEREGAEPRPGPSSGLPLPMDQEGWCSPPVAQSVDAMAKGVVPRAEQPTVVVGLLSAVIFTSFIGYYGLLCVRPDWGGDFQLYCAGVARLYRDLLHPLHEAMRLPSSQSTVYTPFLVGVALIGKLAGTTPYGALQIAGIFNLCLFAFGACFLYSRVSLHRQWWLPAACFVFVTLFLRWRHSGWASELSLTNLQYIQPYPGTFAWGLALVTFGLLGGPSKKIRWIELAALTATASLLLSSHVLTAGWVVGVIALHSGWVSIRQRSVVPLARAIGVIGVAVGLVLLWPYGPFLDQIGDTPLVRSMQHINRRMTWGDAPLAQFPTLYALAGPCFAYVWWRLRRHAFWLAALVATLGALWLSRQMGLSYGNRYAAFAVFFADFIVAEVAALGIFALFGPLPQLPSARNFARWDRPLSIAVLAVAALSWLASPMRATAEQTEDYGRLPSIRAAVRRLSPKDAYYRQFADVAPHVHAEDVVMMPVSRAVLDFASTTGASVVATQLAMRVSDGNARFRAVARFFDARTSGDTRVNIVGQYGATKILLSSREFHLLPSLIETFGEPIVRTEQHALLVIEN
jgi:hypothetical protein